MGHKSAPAFVDVDNDGDMDLLIGRGMGDLKFFYDVIKVDDVIEVDIVCSYGMLDDTCIIPLRMASAEMLKEAYKELNQCEE